MIFTVTGVAENVRDWNSAKGGPMKAYRMDLQDADGTLVPLVEWSRKVTSDPPAVGQVIEGEVRENGNYGLKFEMAKAGGFNGGGGGKDFKADPVKQAAIAMESAQKSAVEIVRLAMDCKAWTPSQDGRPISEMTEVVKTVAKSLHAQIIEASEAAK